MKRIIFICALFATINACAGVVADTLYMEARGEKPRGLRAVATVIFNRAQNTGKSFDAVCLQPFQFSCWNRSKTRKIAPKTDSDAEAYKTCLAIEKRAFNGQIRAAWRLDTLLQPAFVLAQVGTGRAK